MTDRLGKTGKIVSACSFDERYPDLQSLTMRVSALSVSWYA